MWIIIVIIAHFLNAINYVIDKLLLNKFVRSPIVYAFMIGVLGMLAMGALPWAWYLPALSGFVIDLLAGAALILALLFFFKSLQIGETSRVVPLIGGLIPVFTFILSYIFLAERLTNKELLAFILLLIGSVVISLMEGGSKKKREMIRWGYIYGISAALLFAASFVLTKYAYIEQEFLSAFIWIRLGSFLVVLLFLVPKKKRKMILTSFKGVSNKARFVFVGNQAIGAGAYVLLSYAISLASVSLINALQGIQYVFLVVAMAILVKFFPKYFKEKITAGIVVQKVFAIILIGAGLFFLAY